VNYGAFESHPCIYDEREGWVLFDRKDGWKEIHIAEIQQTVRPMTEAEFNRTYGTLPALPKAAFP
jgi:hypothetical protein